MEEESLVRLRRICRIGSWVAVIVGIFMVLLLVSSAVNLTRCSLDPEFCLPVMDHFQSCVSSMEDLLMGAFGIILCVIAYRLLRINSDGYTPFTRENVTGMKTIAAVSIIGFAIILCAQIFMILMMNPDEWWIDFPMSLVILAVITYVFALLMEYGTVLQTESDHFL